MTHATLKSHSGFPAFFLLRTVQGSLCLDSRLLALFNSLWGASPLVFAAAPCQAHCLEISHAPFAPFESLKFNPGSTFPITHLPPAHTQSATHPQHPEFSP